MTLQEAQRRISSSEFTLWKVYISEEAARFHRDDHNFAMIAAEIRRVLSKKPNRVKHDDFLLQFTTPREQRKKKKQRQELQHQKAMWALALGIKPPALEEDKDDDDEENTNPDGLLRGGDE